MIECSYCDNEAVMMSGYKYCVDHLGAYEVRFFEHAVKSRFKSGNDMINFLEWAFGTPTPRLSMLRKWHSIIPRGEWDEERQRYNMSQDAYINLIASRYLKRGREGHEGKSG